MGRTPVAITALLLTATAWWKLGGGQAAVAWSKPGHEDYTFWINHAGLEELDFEGEAGFGDLARVLMRRRSNAPLLRNLRDRFVFRSREIGTLSTPDLLREGNTYIAAAGRVLTIPAIRNGRGHLFRLREPNPGVHQRTVDGHRITVDVRPLVRLKVELRDEENQPTAARVYLTGSDGLGYAPRGSVSRFASEPAEQFFHTPGGFEIDLPAGPTTIEASRGIEYRLTAHHIDLRSPSTVTLRLARWTHAARRGWYSSDAHIHANYTAPHHQDITPTDVLTYTLAEDLNLPNMMVANSGGSYVHDRAHFEGKPHPLSRPPYLIYWNQEMRGSLGHMCFYGLKSLVEPVYTGFGNTPNWQDYPPNFAQARRAIAQGGAATYAHPGYAPNFDGASMKEMPAAAANGDINAMDVMSNNPEEVAVEMWYRLLNCGRRIGISAGSDAFTNVTDHYIPGGHRVYAYTGGGLDYAKWLEAFKSGRTFATNGPMLYLTVNGQEPGSQIDLAQPGAVQVSLESSSPWPDTGFELVVNGRAVSPVPKSVKISESSWIAARAKGPWNRMVLNDGAVFAHTSPVWIQVAVKPVWSAADAAFWVDWLDKLIQRTRDRGRYSTEERRGEALAYFERARDFYRAGPRP